MNEITNNHELSVADTCICLSEVGEQLINILELMVAVALILLVALLICFTNCKLVRLHQNNYFYPL